MPRRNEPYGDVVPLRTESALPRSSLRGGDRSRLTRVRFRPTRTCMGTMDTSWSSSPDSDPSWSPGSAFGSAMLERERRLITFGASTGRDGDSPTGRDGVSAATLGGRVFGAKGAANSEATLRAEEGHCLTC